MNDSEKNCVTNDDRSVILIAPPQQSFRDEAMLAYLYFVFGGGSVLEIASAARLFCAVRI